MATYIVRRLLWMIVLLLIISFLTFLIFSKLPSADPVALRAGRNATPELRASIRVGEPRVSLERIEEVRRDQ